jgi:hypothetical protein
MATAIISPAEIEKFVPQVVSQAQHLTVSTGEDYEMACTFLQFVASRKKQVEEVFDPIVTKAHAAHKEAVAQKKKFMDPLLMAESTVKIKVSTFRTEEERKRRIEEQRLADEARKDAEERAILEAAQLEASGEHELADMVIQNQTEAPAPVVVLESSVPKQSGISGRTNWKYRIVDESLVPREYLSIDPMKVGAVVRSQKGMTKIPGIEVYPESSVSVRA